MKTAYQIMSKTSWTTFGVYEATGPQEALDLFSQARHGKTWKDACADLGLSPDFKIADNNRIYI